MKSSSLSHLVMLVCISCYCVLWLLIGLADCTMYETLPILWVDTKANLKSGDSEIQQTFKFQDPCELFYDPKIVNGTEEYFVNWCRKEIEDAIIKPFEDMCRPDFAKITTRRKRANFYYPFRFVSPLVSSIFGIRYYNYWWYPAAEINYFTNRVNELNWNVQLLSKRIEAGEKRTAELEAVMKDLAENMEKLEERVSKTEIEVDKINEWKDDLIKSLGTTMTLTSKFAAYFEISRSNMNEVKREWKEKRLSFRLFDIFMAGSDEELTSKFKSAKPIKCHVDLRNSFITFLFQKKDTDFGVHVLEGNAFTMYKLIEGSTLGHKLEYIGPKQIAYDSMANCIVPFSGSATEVVLFPGQKDCSPMNDLSVFKYWRKTCEPMYYLDETAIQFKTLGDSYYIYCYGFQIKIYKSPYPCPNYVFKIHMNETIEILSGKLVAKTLKPDDLEPSPDFYSNKIVYHLMPQIMKLNMDTFNLSNICPTADSARTGKLIELPEDQFKSAGAADASGNTVLYIIVFLSILVNVIFAVGIVIYVRRRTALVIQNRYDSVKLADINTVPLLALEPQNQDPQNKINV